jgi:hypothetical protein
MLLDSLLWGYVKNQVYSQRVNMLDEFKAQITAANADITKGIVTACLARGELGGM